MNDKYSEHIDNLVNGPNNKLTLDEQVKSDWLKGKGLFELKSHGDLGYGCMTIFKEGVEYRQGTIVEPLARELRGDDRIAENYLEIIPEHMKEWTFPLTEDQKIELTGILEPYAEWGRKIDGTD